VKISVKNIDELVPAGYNPRKDLKPSDPEYKKLKKSILEFDYVDPVIWNERTGRVVGGHQRLKVLKELGRTEIEVSVVDLSEQKEKVLNLALNKVQGEWDLPSLEDLLAEIKTFDFEDVEITGFGADEIARILKGSSAGKDGLTDPDDVPEPPEEPVTKRGDIWILGNHRLMCGDSRNPDDVAKLMAGKKAALFSTDPPYLVDYTGVDRPFAGKDWTDKFKEIGIKDPEDFFRDVFKAAIPVLEDNAAWFVWRGFRKVGLLHRIWDELGILYHQEIVWVKPAALISYCYYPWQHEECMMGWKKGFKPRHDGIRTDGISSVWQLDWEGKARVVGNEHPTQKPVELFAIPMRKHTLPGDICYEPFCGSGSQIIAGEQNGRSVYAMEISPVFVDVAVRRWGEFSGGEASRNVDGCNSSE
jgi:DNA modification methylase